MKNVNDYVSREIIDEVDNEINKYNSYIPYCDGVKPEDSDYIGSGIGRCVFEKDGKIVKIAKTEKGLQENTNAYNAKERIENHSDKFALPEAISRGGEVLIQEKVKPWKEDKTAEQIVDAKYDKAERFKEKIHGIQEDTGVKCGDLHKPANWGVKDGETVLLDLGKCEVEK